MFFLLFPICTSPVARGQNGWDGPRPELNGDPAPEPIAFSTSGVKCLFTNSHCDHRESSSEWQAKRSRLDEEQMHSLMKLNIMSDRVITKSQGWCCLGHHIRRAR